MPSRKDVREGILREHPSGYKEYRALIRIVILGLKGQTVDTTI
ncbi:predicted protein [Sclerotinia sclerotiorum 1980 UF-70]|uniref:Uncharacterized protein n=1 Tax=Sclerotinia sclerotiorum (strain ATCC 18683 / 1980 / Ss-1) TaxID=665079 RepID=A7E9D6_SCLS1|nr:predicted protein [Sclerotinia sclerotiorum 1980 UF-70]EDN96988.1 predicted protein [Sclerotinia sclerotiorum 1980 UF-70]